jgi:coenzyme PQQ synthesis protein D (PqqD)
MTKEPKIVRSSVVRWSSAAVATEVNHEVVLMNLDRDRCYGLGSTGSDIWRRLRTPIQVSALWTQLEAEYDSAPGQIESDVLKMLREFAAEGLIEVSAGTD